MTVRRCDRPDCSRPAAATLSYRYADRSVWLGGLRTGDDAQHCLCEPHADRLGVPVGWELVDLRRVRGDRRVARVRAVA